MSAGKRRAEVLLVVVLFATPLLAALTMRVVGWTPEVTENHGNLLEAPVQLATAGDERLAERWVLVFDPARPCAAACRDALDALQRVRRGLGGDAHRLLVAHAGAVPAGGQSLVDVSTAPWLARLEQVLPGGRRDNAAYLLDPRGFLVMWYAPQFDPSGVLDDLERLLRYSRVGVQ